MASIVRSDLDHIWRITKLILSSNIKITTQKIHTGQFQKFCHPHFCRKFCHFSKQVFLPFCMDQFFANLRRIVSDPYPFYVLEYFKSYVIYLLS